MDVTAYDSERSTLYISAPDVARVHALFDSSVTGANVIEIVSVESGGAEVTLIGRLPSSAVVGGNPSKPGRLEARVRVVNAFYADKSPGGASVGFLVVQPPIAIEAGTLSDNDEMAQVALRLPIRAALKLGIPVSQRGPLCCQQCNEIIPKERLRAVKSARFCVKCQEMKETNHR
jgi:Prokaryotic dksA/traR C4-type zinc finger